MKDIVDTSIDNVPVPLYYLIRNETGLWHLVNPEERTRVADDEAQEVTTRCGIEINVNGQEDLLCITEWLVVDDVLEQFTADQIWKQFKPFTGQCKSCIKSHEAKGPTAVAKIPIPDNYTSSEN